MIKQQREKLAIALEEINKTELASELRSHHCNDELPDMVSSGFWLWKCGEQYFISFMEQRIRRKWLET